MLLFANSSSIRPQLTLLGVGLFYKDGGWRSSNIVASQQKDSKTKDNGQVSQGKSLSQPFHIDKPVNRAHMGFHLSIVLTTESTYY